MEKEFNVIGPCVPAKHYMVDISTKLAGAMRLIGNGRYFVINLPPQFGKTSLLNALAKRLLQRPMEYVCVQMDFAEMDRRCFESSNAFCPWLVKAFAAGLEHTYPAEAVVAHELGRSVGDMSDLSRFISQFVLRCGRPVVVMVDNADTQCGTSPFHDFLSVLRCKYLDREADGDNTFHSVVLAGVHDVKTAKTDAPWNIASDFNEDLSFSSAEIRIMLEDYAADKSVAMDFEAIAGRLHYYTSGHPFLVSCLCKVLDKKASVENPGFNPKLWTTDDIDWAFRQITSAGYSDANFDALFKNLESHKDLLRLVEMILSCTARNGVSFSCIEPVIKAGVTYGIFRNEQGRVAIHNRIYEQLLGDYFRAKKETASDSHQFGSFIDANRVESAQLDKSIRSNMGTFGYGE